MYVFPKYILSISISPGSAFDAFKLTGSGEICPDIGKMTIGNLESCREAATFYEKPFDRESDWSDHPKGCCLNYDKVYWNTHETGERNDVTKEICVGTG